MFNFFVKQISEGKKIRVLGKLPNGSTIDKVYDSYDSEHKRILESDYGNIGKTSSLNSVNVEFMISNPGYSIDFQII